MLRYVMQRIGLIFLTTIIIIFMVFAFIRSMPDMRIEVMPGEDPAIIEKLRDRDGIGQGPIIEQFFRWVGNIIESGSFGYSLREPREVQTIIGERLMTTVQINVIPYFLSIPIGIGLGIWAALKKNKITDHVISTSVMVLFSVPTFIIAVLLQYYFAFHLNVLPWKVALGSDFTTDIFKGLMSYALPVGILTLGSVVGLTRSTRAELTEVLTSEFMLLTRTKGLNKRQATLRHAIRNAMVPIAPGLIGGIVGILGGSIVIEQIFSIPGIGTLYLERFQALPGAKPDYPTIMALLMFYTFVGLTATLIVDLLYGVIDPRIRMGGGKR